MIKFHDMRTSDLELIQSYTLCGDRPRTVILSFANIISWSFFFYNTQIMKSMKCPVFLLCKDILIHGTSMEMCMG